MSHYAFSVLTGVQYSRLDVYPPSSSAKEHCASTVTFWIGFSLPTQFSKVYEMFLSVADHTKMLAFRS